MEGRRAIWIGSFGSSFDGGGTVIEHASLLRDGTSLWAEICLRVFLFHAGFDDHFSDNWQRTLDHLGLVGTEQYVVG